MLKRSSGFDSGKWAAMQQDSLSALDERQRNPLSRWPADTAQVLRARI